MREFLRGWRRRMGVVTLIVALGLCGLWIGSHVAYCMAAFAFGDRQYVIQSAEGYIAWSGWRPNRREAFVATWESNELTSQRKADLLARQFAIAEHRASVSWVISYRAIVSLLALQSAYLIFRKPPTDTATRTQTGPRYAGSTATDRNLSKRCRRYKSDDVSKSHSSLRIR